MSCFQCKRNGERVCNPAEAEIKCLVCGFCEREELLKLASFQTVMDVECVYCRTIYDHKDGLGQTGITSGICSVCKEEHHPGVK